MNTAKILDIIDRMKNTRSLYRAKLLQELFAEIDSPDEGADTPTRKPPGESNNVAALRDMLQWDEVKSNPVASMRVARMLVNEREK